MGIQRPRSRYGDEVSSGVESRVKRQWSMRQAIILAMFVVFALSSGKSAASSGDEPITVAPVAAAVPASGRAAYVTIAAANVSAGLIPRGSLIVYAPDGTMLSPRARLFHGVTSTFRVWLGAAPQIGTYTVFGTVELGSQAFGMPTSFEVTAD